MVYSITSRQSFDEILVFQQQILRVKDKDDFPIIVVGNKCDLEGERQVSKQGMQYTIPRLECCIQMLIRTFYRGRSACPFIPMQIHRDLS